MLLTEQCCSGQGADLEKFLVTSGSQLDRLDRWDQILTEGFSRRYDACVRWSSNWQNLASQKLDRLGQQNSYDHDTIVKGQKVLESLLVEGIDKCRLAGPNRGIRRTSTARPTTTTTTRVNTEELPDPVLRVTENQDLALPQSFDTFQEGEDEEEQEEQEEEQEVLLSGCLDRSRSGLVKVGVSRRNEAGRDFHVRVCDQETGGGGWTVGGSMSSSLVVTTCMLAFIV